MNSRTPKLERVLDIAREQRRLLACADLDAIKRLQAERQELLEDIQSVDTRESGEAALCGQILRIDEEIRRLLSLKLVETEGTIQRIARLKRLLRTRHRLFEESPRHLSCRI